MNDHSPEPAGPLAGALGARAPWIAAAALLLALLSLGVNGYLLWRLRGAEERAVEGALRLVDRLEAEDARLRYRIRLPEGMPIRMDIPVDERLQVRINTHLPIDTQIRVPIRSPLGSYSVAVPIRADVPIRTEVPLHVRHTFRLRTRTEDELVIPLEVRVRDLPLEVVRESLQP